MRELGGIVFFCMLSIAAISQTDFHVPVDYKLDSAQHYLTYEADAWKSMKSYVKAGYLEEETAAHSRARAFNVLWLAGHPTLRLELNSDAMPFIKENEELLYLFMFGSALKYHQSEGTCDAFALHKAGLDAVLDVAEESKELKKLPSVKKRLKQKRKGTLEAWLKSQLAKE